MPDSLGVGDRKERFWQEPKDEEKEEEEEKARGKQISRQRTADAKVLWYRAGTVDQTLEGLKEE